jgi:L-asparaginase
VNANNILVVTTGGTIDKVYFDALSEFRIGQSVVGELLREAHVKVDYQIVEACRKDSLDLTNDDRQHIRLLVEEATQSQIVVTHGTDTMSTTAELLADIPDKTIVLTGSLSPARFAQTDATFNVGMAFSAAQTLKSGVYVVMSGQVFEGGRVKKDRENNRFVST